VHDYLLSTEVVRFAFVLGVAVSMMLYERRHLTTGSIVVPGYIAVFIVYPLIVVATFVNALLSYVILNKLLRRWFLLYGRTKFTVLAMVSILIQTVMLKLSPSGPWLWESDIKLVVGVGYVVPALIAHDMGRQGVRKTIKSVLLASGIVAIPIALALLVDMPGVNELAPLQGAGEMAIDPAWFPVAVLLSAAASWGVAHNYNFRSGGFVGAAFVGMLLGDPWQVVVAVTVAMITYLFVTRFLMGSMILFGRRKFSAMLLVSSALSWCLLWLGSEIFDASVQEHLSLGSLALTPLFIPGLLANDTQRTGPRRVAFGLAMAGAFVVSTTWWIQSLFRDLPLHIGWKALAVASFSAIFWRQFVPKRAAVRTQIDGPTVAESAAAVVVGGFGPAGFEHWAAMHRDAADAAERWLTDMVGEPIPVAPATSPVVGVPQPESTTVRARRAAMKVLSNEATAAGLPVRKPARRRRTGEFDRISTGIAASVGRPKQLPRQLPRRQRGAALGRDARATGDGQAARVEFGVLPRHQQISESPGAATRAHQAAPGARDTDPTAPREETDDPVDRS
jgi:poly-gamma-glutamate biosynthesis protein PgsC/CapC